MAGRKTPEGGGFLHVFLFVTPAVFLAICAAGCAVLHSTNVPAITPENQPFLQAADLAKLDLPGFQELFGSEETPITERLAEIDARRKKDFLGGVFVFNSQGAASVRLYRDNLSLLAGLNDVLGSSVETFQLGPLTEEFKIPWWYYEGPPVTVAFTYGNALVVMRSNVLNPQEAVTKGLELAKKIAARLLRASGGKVFQRAG